MVDRLNTLSPGKLPRRQLEHLLRYRGAHDRRVVVGPAFGEDAAVIDLGRHYLILKSDPVTFTADEIGWYAVHVNANDVAVMGARPAWFQSTIIVPPRTPVAAVHAIARDIHRAAKQLGIAVTGGHTEVSAAVRQPVVAGDMQGLVSRNALVTSSGATAGDLVVLTKTAAIEGTSILARTFRRDAERILGRRMAERAARFHRVPGISVVEDAMIAARHGATAMHDPTEGGLAAALYELSAASKTKLIVDLDRIAIAEPTRLLCAHFGLRPLGLIASGALLATVRPAKVAALLRALHRRRVPAAVIGEVATGRGVEARSAGKRVRFEWSEKDELTRVPSPKPHAPSRRA